MGEKESLPAWGSLELISKVVITWRDLLKNYSAMTALKDKCRKWYFVPELILLPSAHWKILELLYKSEVSLIRAENDVEDVEWLLLMSMAGFGVRLAPRKCLSLHSVRLEAISAPGADQGTARSSSRTSQGLRTRLWAFSNPGLLLLFKPPCFRRCLILSLEMCRASAN